MNKIKAIVNQYDMQAATLMLMIGLAVCNEYHAAWYLIAGSLVYIFARIR